MKSLGEILNQKKERYFIDREPETRLFIQMLEGKNDCHAMAVYGVGGIGKTSLTDEFQRICNRHSFPFARTDGSVPQTILTVARSIRKQLPGGKWHNHFRQFDSQLKQYLIIQGKIEKSDTIARLSKMLSSAAHIGDPIGLYSKLFGDSISTAFSALRSVLSKQDIDFYLNAEKSLAAQLVTGINRIKTKKLVLIFDAYDRLPSDIRDWIVQSLSPNMGEQVILVFGSEARLGGPWVEWETNGILKQIELKPFSRSSTHKMLADRGIIDKAIADRLFDFTKGHPLYITLSAEIGIEPSKKPIVTKNLIERVLHNIKDPKVIKLFELCAIPRFINWDILNFMGEPSDIIDNQSNRFDNYSFFRMTPKGYRMNEILREFFLTQLIQTSPIRYRELNERALRYYQSQLTTYSSLGIPSIAIEAAYHQLVLSEKEGLKYCIDLFSSVDSTLDMQLATSVIKELEEFSFTNTTIHYWTKALKARLAYLQSDWAKALEEYNSISKKVTEPELKILVLNGLAIVFAKLNKLREAIEHAETALALSERTKHLAGMQDALYTIGLAKQRQGEFREAIARIEKRIRFSDEGCRVAFLMELLGLLYLSIKEHDQAWKHYKRALELWKGMGSAWRVAASQFGLASVLCGQGKWKDAENILKSALKVYQDLNDFAGSAVVMSKLARVKLGMGNFRDAIKFAGLSRTINEKVGNHHGLTLDLNILAMAYANLGECMEAIKYYNKSLIYAKEGENQARLARTFLNIAIVYFHLGNERKATEYIKLAWKTAKNIELKDVLSEIIELTHKIKTKGLCDDQITIQRGSVDNRRCES